MARRIVADIAEKAFDYYNDRGSPCVRKSMLFAGLNGSRPKSNAAARKLLTSVRLYLMSKYEQYVVGVSGFVFSKEFENVMEKLVARKVLDDDDVIRCLPGCFPGVKGNNGPVMGLYFADGEHDRIYAFRSAATVRQCASVVARECKNAESGARKGKLSSGLSNILDGELVGCGLVRKSMMEMLEETDRNVRRVMEHLELKD